MADMYPVMKAQRMGSPRVDGLDQAYGTPESNDSTQKNPKHSGRVPAGTSTSTAAPILPVHASPPSSNKCGMNIIGLLKVFMAYMIAIKFLYFVGKEEMPENVCWAIAGGLFILFMFLHCLDGTKHKNVMLLHLPCFGAQFIQLVGILAFLGYHFYGYFKKGDILYAYRYCTDNGLFIIIAVLLWLFDVLAALWVLGLLYQCYDYLRRLNKNH